MINLQELSENARGSADYLSHRNYRIGLEAIMRALAWVAAEEGPWLRPVHRLQIQERIAALREEHSTDPNIDRHLERAYGGILDVYDGAFHKLRRGLGHSQ